MKTIRNSFFGDDVEVRKHPIYDVYCFSDGSVQTIPYDNKSSTQRLYNPSGDSHKYYSIRVYVNGARKCKAIHRMLAEAFLDNPQHLPCIDHINRNCHDNRVCNLRWASYETNNNNTLKQINASTDKAHVSHVSSCKKYYKNKVAAGYTKQRVNIDGRIVHRWIKK